MDIHEHSAMGLDTQWYICTLVNVEPNGKRFLVVKILWGEGEEGEVISELNYKRRLDVSKAEKESDSLSGVNVRRKRTQQTYKR